MDLQHDTETIEDLSALAWVHDELRRSLETAHKSLRRYLKEADAVAGSDVDAVDPSVLRTARAQLHQSVGALELVGLPTAAQVLRASEAALQKLTSTRPVKLGAKHVECIEAASFALLDYLSRLLSGKPVSPLALFPQYREVQELAGADRVHPADLWPLDWQWRDVAGDGAKPRAFDAALRSEVELLTLALMRQGAGEPALALSELFAGLAAGSDKKRRHIGTLWHMAAAFFEAQGQHLLVPDVYSKRIASRLLAQLRMSEHVDDASARPDAGADVSQRLAQDLLFFCAQASSPGDGRKAPRLAAVRQAWSLARRAPVDYLVTTLGRHDPAAIVQARKRVSAAKESWAAVAGSELHRLSSLNEQFSLVGESLKKLYPAGDQLGSALSAAAAQTVQSGTAPAPMLAMEVATAVLFLEASLDDGDFDHPAQAERVQRLANRIHKVSHGAQPEPLDAWMEELYRRVSDRQTMGSVVQELKGSLAEAEKAIDLYFREPVKADLLHPVPGQLNSMRGVFSVLGLDQASQAVVRMRDDVDALAASAKDEKTPDAAITERLATNLGALGFLIDMLNVQPAMAKALFAFDAKAGQLRAVVATRGRPRVSAFGGLDTQPAALAPVEPRLIEQAQSLATAASHPEVPLVEVRHELDRLSQEAMVADQPVLAETMQQVKSAFEVAINDDERRVVREELAQAMTDFVQSTTAASLDELPPLSRPLPLLPSPPTPAGQTGLEDDVEMREIFLEEAREVIGNASTALAALVDDGDDVNELTTVRRAFHTLKGSARMVGLVEFGEAGWSCEQLYNARLAEQQGADASLIALSTDILSYMSDWVDAIGASRAAGHSPADVTAAIERWRASGSHSRLALPIAARAPAKGTTDMGSISRPMALEGLLPDELADQIELLPAANVQPLDAMLAPDTPVSFELDLGEAAHLEVGGRDAMQSLASPEREAGAPSPDVVSALMALEFQASTLDAPASEAPPADASAATGPMHFDAPPAPELPPEPAYRMVGTLRVGIPLYNIFLNEADEQSRRLGVELAEWSHEFGERPVGDTAIALAHSLAGNSATVGFVDLSHLARLLEHALMRSNAIGVGDAEEAQLFNDSADEISRLLHQFAAGFLKSPTPALIDRLVDHERVAAARVHALAERPAEAVAEAPAPLPEPLVEVAAFDPQIVPIAALGQAEFHQLTPLEQLPSSVERRAVSRPKSFDGNDDIDAVDVVDAELFPIFQEEAAELLPELASRMRDWAHQPGNAAGPTACMRTLHTLKGGARLAGAMRLGEIAHRLETAIEHLTQRQNVSADDVEGLFNQVDALGSTFERLVAGPSVDLDLSMPEPEPAPPEPLPMRPMPVIAAKAKPASQPLPPPIVEPTPEAAPQADALPLAALPQPAVTASAAPLHLAPIDWQRFAPTAVAAAAAAVVAAKPAAAVLSTVRVRAPLLDRLVNHAGEVMIARSRIESEVGTMKGSLGDLTENLERLRSHLRDIELQAETQISSRMEAAKAVGENFDPLEMDRFTRFQELTRMMAESVNDVATVQRSLTRTLQLTEDDLAAQARLTRDMQDDLLRTRMVEFESLSDRLYRVARQAAKELHKQVRLDIVGGSIEVDRGVLERMGGAFEHLLRNCVTHGIELPEDRMRAGKDAAGQITVTAHQEGNEVSVEFRDDGAGLDLPRIRERGLALGLIAADAAPSDGELANLIFTPGFSTAETVTELAGRGVGMDVVRNDVNALGGRIETASAAGQGTNFKLVLPLTTAVTQVVMLRAGAVTVAVPATLIDIVRRVPSAEVAEATRRGSFDHGEKVLPFFWFGALLQGSGRSDEAAGRTLPVVIIKSAAQRIALHVDEVVGNQEVVVKNLGVQLARLPGLAGVTLLASGAPALIYNPVALATLYGQSARLAMQRAGADQSSVAGPQAFAKTPAAQAAANAAKQAPLVLVVDDSLTVRRVTQRLLTREGYRVTTAKDGLDALEKLAEETPVVVLSDIEMPRMDGFDLARNVRADTRWAGLPIIMITSRIAQKHREHAAQLGVNHYLGKPYSEDDLLGLVAQYAGQMAAAVS